MAAYGLKLGDADFAFGSAPSHSVSRPRRSFWSSLKLAGSVAAERRALASLDAHELRDIGLSAEAAMQEAERGLFDLPKSRRA